MVKGSRQEDLQGFLEETLEELKRFFGMGSELNVVWLPGKSQTLAGQVLRTTILIYEESRDKAKKVLLHEFLDYCVSRLVEPYRDMLNSIIKMENEKAYRRKEEIVENLSKAFSRILDKW